MTDESRDEPDDADAGGSDKSRKDGRGEKGTERAAGRDADATPDARDGAPDETGQGDAAEGRKKWMPGVKRLPSSSIPKDRITPAPPTEEPKRAAKPRMPLAPREGTSTGPSSPGGEGDGEGAAPDTAVKRLGVGFDKDAVRAIIERHFRVYDEKDALPGLGESVLVAYFVMGHEEGLQRHYERLRDELHALDPRLVPMLRVEGGETIVVMTRRGHEPARARRLPVVLFILTLLSLVFSGSVAWLAYEGRSDLLGMFEPERILLGAVTFALPLLGVLLVQDMARRIAAKRHGVRLGQSWWVPVPPLVFIPSIGSLGTMLQSRDPFPDRKALFDVGVSGPLAGFAAAIPLVIIGLLLTNASAVVNPDGNDLALTIQGPDGLGWVQQRDGMVDVEASTANTSSVGFAPQSNGSDDGVEVTLPPALWRVDDRRAGYGGDIVLGADLRVPAEANQTGLFAWNVTVRSTGDGGDAITFNGSAWALDHDGRVVANHTWNGSVAAGGLNATAWPLGPDVDRVLVRVDFALPDETTVALGEPSAFSAIQRFLGTEGDYVIHPTALAGWTALMLIGISLLPIGRFDGGLVARAILGDNMQWSAYVVLITLLALSFRFLLWVHVALYIVAFVKMRLPPPLNDTTALDSRRMAWAAVAFVVFLLSFVWIPAYVPELDLFGRLFGF